MAQAGAAEGLTPPAATSPALSRFWLRAVRPQRLDIVIAVELIAILVAGILIITRYPIWGPVDEGAHYAYVEQIVEHRALPVLGETPTTEPVIAISRGVSPDAFSVDLHSLGLSGLSYEAFQPPLYYLLAAPVFAVVPGYLNKVYALRGFDLALLLLAAGLALVLCRDLLGRRWRYGGAVVLGVLLIPGVVVNAVPVSNAALALPAAIGFLLVALRAVAKPSSRPALGAGALLAVCVLTEVQLAVLAPVFLVVLWRLWRRSPDVRQAALAVAVAAVPLVIVAPWLAFNEVHFHALTAEALSVQLQNPVINPHHVHYSLHSLPYATLGLGDVLLPQDWNTPLFSHAWWLMLDEVDKVILFPVLAVGMLVAWRRLWGNRAALLAVPLIGVTVSLWWVTYVGQWFVMNSRYTDWALPAWALLGAIALLFAGGRRLVAALGVGLAGVSAVTWVLMARAFLF